MIDGLLPICGQNVTVVPVKALIDLETYEQLMRTADMLAAITILRTLAQAPVYSSGTGA
ncbi:hypothetical protein AVDCRST_MAG94-1129 [uncultured Leptolyngbya sp.]|uniref:Uncharacterized protein n=1 Tax=uncultured Leptolyngbya sp. TaxID=332963 RepID=A0A6J4KT41_9CYAN|nr:hypothetical protein AVDCRST_MAG94-1129 [uncultured Leptolyngbya sp.]